MKNLIGAGFLMGIVDDTYEQGMYPLIVVENITKNDMIRCEKFDIIIINLNELQSSNYKKNVW